MVTASASGVHMLTERRQASPKSGMVTEDPDRHFSKKTDVRSFSSVFSGIDLASNFRIFNKCLG